MTRAVCCSRAVSVASCSCSFSSHDSRASDSTLYAGIPERTHLSILMGSTRNSSRAARGHSTCPGQPLSSLCSLSGWMLRAPSPPRALATSADSRIAVGRYEYEEGQVSVSTYYSIAPNDQEYDERSEARYSTMRLASIPVDVLPSSQHEGLRQE